MVFDRRLIQVIQNSQHLILDEELIFGNQNHQTLMAVGKILAHETEGAIPSPSGEYVDGSSNQFYLKMRTQIRDAGFGGKNYRQFNGIVPNPMKTNINLGDLVLEGEEGTINIVGPNDLKDDNQENILGEVGCTQDQAGQWIFSKDWWLNNNEALGDLPGGVWAFNQALPSRSGRGRRSYLADKLGKRIQVKKRNGNGEGYETQQQGTGRNFNPAREDFIRQNISSEENRSPYEDEGDQEETPQINMIDKGKRDQGKPDQNKRDRDPRGRDRRGA